MGYSDIKDLLKDAQNFATGANDLQLKNVLLDIQNAVYELQEENRELREENHNLKNVDIIKDELEYKDNAYYYKEKGPYCSTCFDNDGKLVNLILERVGGKEFKKGNCNSCGASGIQTGETNPKYKDEIRAMQASRLAWNKRAQQSMDDF